MGSLSLRPAILLFGNLRPLIAQPPLPHATKAYGQLLGRDLNPLDLMLLLRTVSHQFKKSNSIWCLTPINNTRRILIKHLESISDADVMELNIPTGKAVLYEFDERMNVLVRYDLDDGQTTTRAA